MEPIVSPNRPIGVNKRTRYVVLAGLAAIVVGAGTSAWLLSHRLSNSESAPPSALDVWARAVGALDSVQSVRMQRAMPQNSNVTERVVFTRGGAPSDPNYVPWRSSALLPVFPPLGYSITQPPSYMNVHLVGEEPIDGAPQWVLSMDGIEGGIDTVRYFTMKVWIDKKSYLIRRVEDRTTRGEGCCGVPEPGLNAVLEYTDYQPGTPLAEALATPTPSAASGTMAISPTSGPCPAAVTINGSDLPPNADVSVYIVPSVTSAGNQPEEPLKTSTQTDQKGSLSFQLRTAAWWCALDAVVWHTVGVRVLVNAADQFFDLQYEISPCRPPSRVPLLSGYCSNMPG